MVVMLQSIPQYLLIGAIVFLGQFIYASLGFGSGMVTISLLALCYGDIHQFVPFFILLCLPTELIIASKDRNKIKIADSGLLLSFIIPFLAAGCYLLTVIVNRKLEVLLGLIIVSLAIYYLFYEGKAEFRLRHRAWGVIAGSLSGLLAGMYGIGGPPLIFYFKSIAMDKQTFRANLLSIFLVMSCGRVVVYSLLGLYPLAILLDWVAMLPFVALGIYSGQQAHDHISELRFKQLTSLILLASGLLLLARNI